MKEKVEHKSNAKEILSQAQNNKQVCFMKVGLKQGELAAKEVTNLGAVDTGRMRASASFSIGENEVIVGNTAEYAIYVTLGTRRMEARPFMQNSINNYLDTYRDIIKEHMKKGF